MARKTAMYAIETEGRDKGKVFFLTELPASRGEDWAARVILALMASGVNLPDDFASLGMAGLAQLGLRALAGLKWDVAKPLLAEMFDCIELIPDPKKTHVRRPLIDDPEDIEEIRTRLELRMEVWKLHMGFLEAAFQSLDVGVREAAASVKTIRTSAK